MGEANLPAQEAQAHAHARVSGSDADSGRPGGGQGPSAEGSRPADCLTQRDLGHTWRVRDRATFATLVASSRRRRGPVSLAFVPGDQPVPPRLAYAVGRQVGPAVVRNHVRRRLRASVDRHRSWLEAGGTYLFGTTPAAVRASFAELDTAVGELLRVTGQR